MWPFTKKASVEANEPEPTIEVLLNSDWHVGDRVTYLGIKMLVCRVGRWDMYYGIPCYDAAVWCDYADSAGVVRNIKFNFEELNNLYEGWGA